jgi:hypothetical protein
MKKETLWLLFIGGLLTISSFITSLFIDIPEAAEDFLKGFGVALIVAALFLQRKSQKTNYFPYNRNNDKANHSLPEYRREKI